MQKENPVIKNYIFSSKKRVLEDYPPLEKPTFETLLYRVPLEQNKGFSYLFLLRK